MNGPTKRYKESLARTGEPILLSQCPNVKMDLKGLMEYAKKHEKKVIELTDTEKKKFMQ